MMNKGLYNKFYSTATPGLIVILIDQSYSMSESYITNPLQNKSEFASLAVNRFINEVIEANSDGESVKNRLFIAVIGYGNGLNMISADYLDSLSKNPKRYEKGKRSQSDGLGGIIEIDFDMPIWIEPLCSGSTSTHLAFNEAYKVIDTWTKQRRNSPCPIVINITSNFPDSINETLKIAERIKTINDTLLFNVVLSEQIKDKIALPSNINKIEHNSLAEFFFNITSEIPETMFFTANKIGLNPIKGAKGLLVNEDPEQLFRLFDFSS